MKSMIALIYKLYLSFMNKTKDVDRMSIKNPKENYKKKKE